MPNAIKSERWQEVEKLQINGSLMTLWVAFIVTLLLSLLWLRFIDFLATKQLIFTNQGFLLIDFVDKFPKIILINVIATIVESLPLQDWDNITVPAIVVLLSLILI